MTSTRSMPGREMSHDRDRRMSSTAHVCMHVRQRVVFRNCRATHFPSLLFSAFCLGLFTAAGAGAFASFFLSFLPVRGASSKSIVRRCACVQVTAGRGTRRHARQCSPRVASTHKFKDKSTWIWDNAARNNQDTVLWHLRTHSPDFAGPGTSSPVRSCRASAHADEVRSRRGDA